MIRVILTDEQGTVLGGTTLDPTDADAHGRLPFDWVGQKVVNELPSNREALAKLLGKPNKED